MADETPPPRPVYPFADRREQVLLDLQGEWDYSTLPPNIVVGKDCFIENRNPFAGFLSTRDPGMIIGDRVRVYLGGWGASFSVEDEGFLEIGADSIIAGAQFLCAERITLGRGVVVSYNAVITDCDFHPTDAALRRSDAISGSVYGEWFGFAPRRTRPVVIGDGVKIGINAIVLKGVTIGAGAEIGAGTVVSADVPPGVTVVGNPFTIVGPAPSP